MLFAHLVAHTHWDREWYHPLVRFRQRLVALIDELLDDPPGPNESFLLDGQAIVVEDYLAVRPEREEELSTLLWNGRLEAGPWYVLADELIPGGEALVRNLLLGRRVLRRFHAESPPVLYCPDSFGHPAALPSIALGFGLPLIILWRGYGSRRFPGGDTFEWRAPDGQRVIAFHLPPNGYEFGSDLPTDASRAQARWLEMRRVFAERSVTNLVLVQNGADHHARQSGQRDAVAALARAASDQGDTLRASSLRIFAEALRQDARRRELPEVTGELRDSYGYTWTLQGTFGTRAAQKRRNAVVERSLARDAEPWAALARLTGAASRLPLLVAAWRSVIQTHPHDTLCGCSIDEVAAAMDRRLDDAVVQGAGIRDDAIADLVGYDPELARTRPDEWRPVALVRNRAARPRGGVAIVELQQFIANVPVGPGSAPKASQHPASPETPRALAGHPLQPLGTRVAYSRVESPRHYPDNDLVAVTRAAVWVDEVPAYGIRALPFGDESQSGENETLPPNVVRTGDRSLDNGIVRVSVDDHGRVVLESLLDGRRIVDLVNFNDLVDRGDLYTPSVHGAASRPSMVAVRITRAGPLLGELRLDWSFATANDVTLGGEPPSEVTARIVLTADSPLVRLHVNGRNRGRDHRLQLVVTTGVRKPDVWADAAFGPVHREPLVVPADDRRMETPPATAPLHRYVSVFGRTHGATLFSDGLAEYESRADGALLVTLLRAVGELSRNDIPERPGHAGWPAPTPRAQSIGRYTARFAVLLHGPRTSDIVDAIERASDDALLPLEGYTLRSALEVPPPIAGAALSGVGLAFSALKESEDGEWIVARCVNLLDEPVDGTWRFGMPVREARYARLDETRLEPLEVGVDGVAFRAGPRAVVTILVR